MEKVKLTKEQAHTLKEYEDMWSDETIVEMIIHAKENGASDEEEEVLIKLSTDKLIRALYIGYEVEQTVEEQLEKFYDEQLEVKVEDQVDSFYAIKKTLDIIGMKVKGINA